MKPISMFLSVFAAGALAFAADPAAGKMDPKMQEMMKKYEAAGKVGPEHKRLAELTGTWKTSSQMWQSADAKPETATGTATFKPILGGRWLQQEFRGKAMGQDYEGLGLVGYDNVKGQYQSLWMDTMSTGLMKAEGTYDASTKTLKDKGTFSCPIEADKTGDFRSEWQMGQKNKLVFSLYGPPPGGGAEFKMMEITYTK